jgi:hypothetical protein
MIQTSIAARWYSGSWLGSRRCSALQYAAPWRHRRHRRLRRPLSHSPTRLLRPRGRCRVSALRLVHLNRLRQNGRHHRSGRRRARAHPLAPPRVLPRLNRRRRSRGSPAGAGPGRQRLRRGPNCRARRPRRRLPRKPGAPGRRVGLGVGVGVDPTVGRNPRKPELGHRLQSHRRRPTLSRRQSRERPNRRLPRLLPHSSHGSSHLKPRRQTCRRPSRPRSNPRPRRQPWRSRHRPSRPSEPSPRFEQRRPARQCHHGRLLSRRRHRPLPATPRPGSQQRRRRPIPSRSHRKQ